MKQRLFTRNFAFLISGQISSLMGNYALKFALSMYVLEQTGSAGIFAGLLALSMLPTILLSPLGGILADRANRRNIMVGLDLLSGLFVLAAGLILSSGLLPSSGGDLSLIGALLIILSVLAAFESPTVQACVPQMLSGDNLLKGNALVSQVSAVSGLIAPFLGSLLYSAVGILPVLWAAAACFFLTALLECFIRLNYQPPQKAPGLLSVIREDFSDSMRFLRRKEPDILKLLLLAALVSLFVAGTTVVGFPYLVRTVLGLSPEYYGAAESAMGLSAILGTLSVALLAGKFLPRHLAAVFVSFGLCLIPSGLAFLLPLGTLSRYFVLLIMFCASQLGCCIFSTYAITLVQGRTPQQLMGKVMAYVYTLSMCAQPLGQLMYGALFDLFSASPYWVLIPSGLVVSAIGLASVRFFRRLEG
ncbi:MAG TPA: MFS transporter [Candidatus Egerieimonas intestinavium]|uniref:MFS transporter n=1 Tax=Candidatus Egerieimonas intestinavium TaxID=2840777 RepID=A0A9D1EI05_9FIRM|nr:MFS transporter [Candidatus Egerieimonas intestinavium]